MAGIVLSDENFAALESAMDTALEADTPQSYTALEVVLKYQEQLRQIVKKYNHEKALEILKGQGIEITKFTLIQYLSEPKKGKKKVKNKSKSKAKSGNNKTQVESEVQSNSSTIKSVKDNESVMSLEHEHDKSISKLSGHPIDSQVDLASEFNLDI